MLSYDELDKKGYPVRAKKTIDAAIQPQHTAKMIEVIWRIVMWAGRSFDIKRMNETKKIRIAKFNLV